MMRSILLLIAVAMGVAGEAAPTLPPPSANAGKAGTYQGTAAGAAAGYTFHVCVPDKPAADAHYGLHLFFHGQNGQGGAPSFGQWKARMLDRFGLIGINMAYADGDNMKDTDGKVAAARAAVLQVMADYPVVPGRGVVACFSGGGLPCGRWFADQAKNRGLAWPFTQLALYSANYRAGVQPIPGLGWYVGVNTEEWTLAELGRTQTGTFAGVMAQVQKIGPDHRFLIVPGIGHTIPDRCVDEAASLFRRIDLAYAPFLHQPSFPAKPLAPIIAAANAGQIGAAAAALARLKPDAVPAEQSDDLRSRLDARAAAQVALIGELAASDPMLAAYYGGIFAKGLKGHAREADLTVALAPVLKDRKRSQAASAALDMFAKGYSTIFAGGPRIAASAVPMLEQVAQGAGAGSALGTMASELLALPHAQEKERK